MKNEKGHTDLNNIKIYQNNIIIFVLYTIIKVAGSNDWLQTNLKKQHRDSIMIIIYSLDDCL